MEAVVGREMAAASPVPWTPGTGDAVLADHPEREGILVAHAVITSGPKTTQQMLSVILITQMYF